MKIIWLGQSGYLLSDGITTICIDPYLSDAVNRIAGRPRMVGIPILPEKLYVDAVICTHNHVDHVDPDAIPKMQKENMIFYAPTDCKQTLMNLGVTQYLPFDEGTRVVLGNFILEAVFADHTVPAIGVVVTHAGKRYYFTGDTYYHPKLADIKCDVLFVSINGKLGNMDVEDAIRLTNEIKPQLAVPNHYGMFASNTEDPEKYMVPNRFIMEWNKEYNL
ncbi:MBL fold metallo-hydrolase [Ructibacterium gallinarum]|uniref:MBL fold metallo-hydrolase n=1 Tax=Ructibacterium gallinarum TaxID=2779355 RepID=A0A9D5M041_9FIRM|nr:MBL fold metallo-hydrolase [Ructibacterium gallinarum]MBE5041253.1 MBL fold metallo-hydrolase [Ructibacterium gallinarum]